MVHVHTQKPNEPSFGAGAHVCLGLALTPTKNNGLAVRVAICGSEGRADNNTIHTKYVH